MGYTTIFDGRITIEPPLNLQEAAYLNKFAHTRRMEREHGPYYVDGGSVEGQAHEADITNYNRPSAGQPGLWCQWVPTHDGTALEWDGGEKFYDAEEWMIYLIDHFLTGSAGTFRDHPNSAGFTFDHVASGTIAAQGEDSIDTWDLVVDNNRVARSGAE